MVLIYGDHIEFSFVCLLPSLVCNKDLQPWYLYTETILSFHLSVYFLV